MKRTIKDFDVLGKTVIIRCDLNVSLVDGKIVDDTRIRESVSTIKYVLDNGGKAIILSHFGKVKTVEDKGKYSLKIVFDVLNKYLDKKLKFVSSLDFSAVSNETKKLPFGSGVLLENTRFYDLNEKLESDCSDKLSSFYASLGDIFINDAFGTIHRKHASNYGISSKLDSGIGFLVEKELAFLDKLDDPKKPFAVIMGGAKVSDKIKVISGLLEKVDKLFVGGAMANTFLKASGLFVGNSIVEDDMIDVCHNLLDKYPNRIMLPIDFNGNTSFNNDKSTWYYITDIPKGFIAMDIGYMTLEMIVNEFSDVKTLFWNGPVGVYEFSNYQKGTLKLFDFVSKNIETSVLGGGDIISACSLLGYNDKFSYISTGGGATLEYLVDKNQPGLVNIKEAK